MTSKAPHSAATRLTLLAAAACALVMSPDAPAQTWTNPGTGSWFDAANWAGGVPLAGGSALVSNGGTATLAGPPATPLLVALSIGLGGFGTGVGAVTSNGVNVLTGGGLSIGSVSSNAALANGRLLILGAGGSAGSVSVGSVISTTIAANATGLLDSASTFAIGAGTLSVAQIFNAARGTVASGTVNIGGDAGTVSFLDVGTAFSTNNDQVGNRATGVVNIAGNLTLAPGTFSFIGATGSPDRVADAAAPGGFRVDEARGAVNLGGTLTVTGAGGAWFVGTTTGGVVDGSLTAGVLSMPTGASLSTLQVGTSAQFGQAVGTVQFGSGDLRLLSGLSVGTTNGGTAQGTVRLQGGQLVGNNSGGLFVGTAGGSGVPAVQAQGTVEASAGVSGFTSYQVGSVFGTTVGTTANGRVIGGAAAPGSSTGAVVVGNAGSTGNATVSATGVLQLGNTLNITNGSLIAGALFDVGRGSVASGAVSIGGDAGTVNFLNVGTAVSTNNNQVGNRATGVVGIGGNLALVPGTSGFIGVTGTPDRVADAAAPGGSRVDEARGAVSVVGTLTVNGTGGQWSVGVTNGGVAEGSLTAGTLSMPAGASLGALQVGTSAQFGQAVGTVQFGSGDLRLLSGLSVGTTNGGTAQGTVKLQGGQLLGNNSGGLFVGTAGGSGVPTVQAQGTVEASAGVSGFTSFQVGNVFGPTTAGTTANGRVIGGAAAPGSSTGAVVVGNASSTGNAPVSATGVLQVGNTLNITDGSLIAGALFDVGRGSVASGAVSIGGDAGTVNFLNVGTAVSTNNNQVGNRATGVVGIGGNLALAPGTSGFIGVTGTPDRVADAAAPGGFRVDEARGAVSVSGTLTVNGTGGQWSVGVTNGGVAEGSMTAGTLSMPAGASLSGMQVGTAGTGGQAHGDVVLGGGVLRVDTLLLGNGFGGLAHGNLALHDTDLQAGQVSAGLGSGGFAQLLLDSSESSVTDSMVLLSGLLALDRSHLGIGDTLTFGDTALMQLAIDGLGRGTEYGAIDAARVLLDGALEIDFSELLYAGNSAIFDVIRSGSADGIGGDFDAFSFLNLPTGYSATAGLEVDGVEVYRVRLQRNDVPEPASWLLAAIGLGVAAGVRRRGRQKFAK